MGMLRRYAPIVLALAALVAGNLYLWLNRPTATPMAPERLFETAQPEPATPANARLSEPAKPRTSPDAGPAKPADKPLDLTLDEPLTAAHEPHGPSVVLPPLPLHLPLDDSNSEPRWTGEDLGLFHSKRGVRGFTRGLWLSDSLRLRGGIGYSRDENTQEYEGAIGLGIDFTF